MKVDLQKIISTREHLGFTQEQAAKAIGVGRTTYIAREKNGDFSKEEIESLAKKFKVKVSELYEKETPIVVEDSLNRLTEIAVRTESLQKAIVVGLAKVLAIQTNVDVSKILEDLTSVANLQSKDFATELQRLVDR